MPRDPRRRAGRSRCRRSSRRCASASSSCRSCSSPGAAKSLFVPLAMAVVFAMLTSYLLSRTLVPTMVHYLLAARGRALRRDREAEAAERRGGRGGSRRGGAGRARRLRARRGVVVRRLRSRPPRMAARRSRASRWRSRRARALRDRRARPDLAAHHLFNRGSRRCVAYGGSCLGARTVGRDRGFAAFVALCALSRHRARLLPHRRRRPDQAARARAGRARASRRRERRFARRRGDDPRR